MVEVLGGNILAIVLSLFSVGVFSQFGSPCNLGIIINEKLFLKRVKFVV